MNGLSDKVVLITGAASGIGLATAERFASEGSLVVMADLDQELGENAASRIETQHGKSMFIPTDVTEAHDVRNLIDRTIDEFGRLDIAHNNVGHAGTEPKPTDKFTEAEWHQEAELTLNSIWRCMKHELPHISDRGGSIINTSSVAGFGGRSNGAPYSTMKHGVIGLTRSAALEYATGGVRINAICPGPVDTPALDQLDSDQLAKLRESVPMGRLADPSEIAGAVAWLASEDASFVTGHSLLVDGGKTA
jgi:NAD(P)-dependent dehydrogenase (short-subunit alcohol dehydrogenase family)